MLQIETTLTQPPLPILFRGLPTPEYADDFANGRIWITTFEYCRKAKDQRRDEGEGLTVYRSGDVQGNMADPDVALVAKRTGFEGTRTNLRISNAKTTILIRDAYLLCLSMERQSKFGAHCVRIDNPPRFFRVISDALFARVGQIELGGIGSVQYMDREYQGTEAEPHPALTKPKSFEDEKEVRMLWFLEESIIAPIEPFLLECPRARRYCKRLPDAPVPVI